MKNIISYLFLILVLGAPAFAQKQKKSSDPEDIQPPETQNKKSAQKAERNGGVLLESGTSIEAQLQQTLDVQKASVGDEIVLKTTRAIKQNGRTVVEKGTRLIGRVTEVQQKTKQNAQSRVGVVIERLQSGNLSAPISATIVSVTQASANASLGDTLDSNVAGSTTGSGSVSRSNSGGGLLGGVTSTVGNTVGGVLNTTTETVGGVTSSTGQTLGKTLNGVRLTQSSDASANGAATLSAQGKNVRIEKGVVFNLRLTQSVEN